jgi:hypothetical protein
MELFDVLAKRHSIRAFKDWGAIAIFARIM